jgi:hypothetical protein
MQILAILSLKEEVSPDKMGPHLDAEVKHTLEAYLDGNIRNFWFRGDHPGVVFMLESTDLDEAHRFLAELPLAVAGLVNIEVIPLKPLQPLGRLIGRGMPS